ncbi:MAG: hypothetical protein L0216_01770 [Planctomycetales bacterium]|nr:hypothetical protein [Planctomycetales bacterium]
MNAAQVRYFIVGGVAVVLHGHLRTTGDLHLAVDLEPQNARKAVEALARLGYQPRVPVKPLDFADPKTRESWIREKGMRVFSLWHPDRPGSLVDIFVRVPFDFAAVYSRAVRLRLATTEAPVIGLEDLIALKRAAGRPQDLTDCEALEALRGPPYPDENAGRG